MKVNNKSNLLLIPLLLVVSACTTRGSTQQKRVSTASIINLDFDKLKVIKGLDVHHMFRAIGAPSKTMNVGDKNYYVWNHSVYFGIGAPLLLGNLTLEQYCDISLETDAKTNKMLSMHWIGNQCKQYKDLIDDYFRNRFGNNFNLFTEAEQRKIELEER